MFELILDAILSPVGMMVLIVLICVGLTKV